jgi:hypothetical protein
MTKKQGCTVLCVVVVTVLASPGRAQTPTPAPHHAVAVPLQPFAVLARRVETALDYLGQPLAAADRQALAAALANTDDQPASQPQPRSSIATRWRTSTSIPRAA